MKKKALLEIEDRLVKSGMNSVDAEHLISRLIEEEALDYVEAMINVGDKDVIEKVKEFVETLNIHQA